MSPSPNLAVATGADDAPITSDAPTQVSGMQMSGRATANGNAVAGPSDREVAGHLRTAFLRRVAHDIASPTGVAMTVLDELASNPAPRPELLAMARRSLRRLMRLSDQLALVAELEGGGLEPDEGEVDLRAIAQKAVEEAVAVDGRRDVVASASLPEGAAWAKGDAKLLGSVFREVVGNALKLAASRVEVSLAVEDGSYVFRVDDDGSGFTEEAVASFGTRFAPKSSMRGLGLSISMATDILGLHGGTIAREKSKLPPGRRGTPGAAVVVRLPAARA